MDPIEFMIREFRARPLRAVSPRLVSWPDIKSPVRVITGARGSGKTSLLFQEMQRLVEAGVDQRHMLYMDFGDERLHPLGSRVLTVTLETFYRLNPSARSGGGHLFFDNIEVVPGWQRFVHQVLGAESAELCLTGSSDGMREASGATGLQALASPIELLPFSLAETLLFAGTQLPDESPNSRVRSRLEAAFDTYVMVGGFPGLQRAGEAERIRALQDQAHLSLLRDVVERRGTRNVPAVHAFAFTLLRASATRFSVNGLARDLNSRGLAVSKDTLHAILEHLVDASLLFVVPVFARRGMVRNSNSRKVYAVDPGLVLAVASPAKESLEARLETAVYLELRRRVRGVSGLAISYYFTATRREVDFVLGDPDAGRAVSLLQVCAEFSESGVRDREVRTMEEAMSETGLTESRIVTMNDAEEIQTAAGVIHVVPAWSWMLRL